MLEAIGIALGLCIIFGLFAAIALVFWLPMHDAGYLELDPDDDPDPTA